MNMIILFLNVLFLHAFAGNLGYPSVTQSFQNKQKKNSSFVETNEVQLTQNNLNQMKGQLIDTPILNELKVKLNHENQPLILNENQNIQIFGDKPTKARESIQSQAYKTISSIKQQLGINKKSNLKNNIPKILIRINKIPVPAEKALTASQKGLADAGFIQTIQLDQQIFDTTGIQNSGSQTRETQEYPIHRNQAINFKEYVHPNTMDLQLPQIVFPQVKFDSFAIKQENNKRFAENKLNLEKNKLNAESTNTQRMSNIIKEVNEKQKAAFDWKIKTPAAPSYQSVSQAFQFTYLQPREPTITTPQIPQPIKPYQPQQYAEKAPNGFICTSRTRKF